jgi:hypothetical protein
MFFLHGPSSPELGPFFSGNEKLGGEHGGRQKKDGSRSEPSNQRPTLAEVGIDKKLSARSQ